MKGEIVRRERKSKQRFFHKRPSGKKEKLRTSEQQLKANLTAQIYTFSNNFYLHNYIFVIKGWPFLSRHDL